MKQSRYRLFIFLLLILIIVSTFSSYSIQTYVDAAPVVVRFFNQANYTGSYIDVVRNDDAINKEQSIPPNFSVASIQVSPPYVVTAFTSAGDSVRLIQNQPDLSTYLSSRKLLPLKGAIRTYIISLNNKDPRPINVLPVPDPYRTNTLYMSGITSSIPASNSSDIASVTVDGKTYTVSSSDKPQYGSITGLFLERGNFFRTFPGLYSTSLDQGFYRYIGSKVTVSKDNKTYAGTWFQLQLPSPIIISSYTVGLSSYDTPGIWYLFGSSDGTQNSWIKLIEMTNTMNKSPGVYTYTIPPQTTDNTKQPYTPYKYYRFVVSAVTGICQTTCHLTRLTFTSPP